MPTSIWNENPIEYLLFKKIYSMIVSLIYPLAFYCVLTKSKKVSHILKILLILHLFCITFQWLVNAWLADPFYFYPMKITRYDGLLSNYFPATTLYILMYTSFFFSIGSCLLIYFNRLFIIQHIYYPRPSKFQKQYEKYVYLFVCFYSIIPNAFIIPQVPNQSLAKSNAVKIFNYLPDCINDSNVVVACDASTNCMTRTSYNYIIWLSSIAFIMTSSTVYSSIRLSRGVKTKSTATRIRHKRFHRNTFLQAFIQMFFATVPNTIANLSVIFQIATPGLVYFIDFVSENHSTSGVVTLFLFYEPYKEYIISLFKKTTKPKVIVIIIRDK
ncbi:unnamed protein product [Caenorhabditis angaria]|uniref:Uncharacterized protein n=1 Tax=Caenorhabditis angaria TaxID=860376 RepID=A0A9P1N510_9PELO|nr:unnamed protein product [Caenorhabditis angaria]